MSDFIERVHAFRESLVDADAKPAVGGHDAGAWSNVWADQMKLVSRNLLNQQYGITTKDRGWAAFKPNPEQEQLLYLIFTRIVVARMPCELMLVKPRQMGASTLFTPICLELTRGIAGTNCVVAANEADNCETVWGAYQRFEEQHPGRETKPQTKYSSKREFVFESINSRMTVGVADNNLGVSGSVQIAHLTETCKYKDYAGTMENALGPAVPTAPAMTLIIKETTGMPGTPFEPEYLRALEAFVDCGSDPLKLPMGLPMAYFSPWFKHPEYRLPISKAMEAEILKTMTPDERRLVRAYTVDMGQLAWRRSKIEKAKERGGIFDFHRNFPETPEEAFSLGAESIFDDDQLKTQMEFARSVTPETVGEIRLIGKSFSVPEIEEREGGRLRIYEPPIPGHTYTIGCDPAGDEGNVGDRDQKHKRRIDKSETVAVVWDDTSGIAVSVWKGIENPLAFADMLAALGHHYNSAKLVVERPQYGHAVLGRLNQLEYPNLYVDPSKARSTSAARAGWVQNDQNRRMVLTRLQMLFRESRVLIPDMDVLLQMASFSPDKLENGRSRQRRVLDDCVLAAAIGVQVSSVTDNGRNRIWAIKDPMTIEFMSEGKVENSFISQAHPRDAERKRRARRARWAPLMRGTL